MHILGVKDLELFRRTLLKRTGVSVCSRIHFGSKLPSEKEEYIRFAFSSASLGEIEEALTALKQFMQDALAKAKL